MDDNVVVLLMGDDVVLVDHHHLICQKLYDDNVSGYVQLSCTRVTLIQSSSQSVFFGVFIPFNV